MYAPQEFTPNLQDRRANVSITRPPCRAIRETLTRTTAGNFRAAYLPPKAGRVNAWLGALSMAPLFYCSLAPQFCKDFIVLNFLFKLQQEILVFGVVFRLLVIFSRKVLDDF